MIRVCVQSISKYLLDYKNSKTRSQARQEIEGGNCQHSFKNSINLPIVFLPRICVHTFLSCIYLFIHTQLTFTLDWFLPS